MKKNQNNSAAGTFLRHCLALCLGPLIAALAWAGCMHSATSNREANPSGSYALVSVDGKSVPCTLTHGGATPTIKSGSFVFNPDGTCSSTMNFSVPSRGDAVREVKASYTHEGPKFIMRWHGAGTTTGTLEGDTFTMLNEGMTLVYRK